MGLSIYEHRSMRVHFKIQKEAADLGAVWLAASTRHSTVFRATHCSAMLQSTTEGAAMCGGRFPPPRSVASWSVAWQVVARSQTTP